MSAAKPETTVALSSSPVSFQPASETHRKADGQLAGDTLLAGPRSVVQRVQRSLAPVSLAIDAELRQGDAHVLMAAFAAGVAELRVVLDELEPASSAPVVAESEPAVSTLAPSPLASGQALSAVQQATAKFAAAQQAAAQFALSQFSDSAPGASDLASAVSQMVSPPTSESPPQLPKPKQATPPAVDLATLRHRLRSIVRSVTTGPSQLLVGPEQLAAVRFALVALVDEWLIYQVNWACAEVWSDNPLEQQMYGTTTAGRTLFARMGELGAGQLAPAARRQLAAVYLLCLRLGFCGEWRGAEERLMGYKHDLLQWLPAGDSSEAAFPQAYAHTKSGFQEERLAPLGRFWRWCLLGLTVYLLVSWAVWIWLSQPLLKLLSEVI